MLIPDGYPEDRGGFTLVELLVVVAAVAILAAILLTSLSMAKKKAQQAYCAQNLRQLGLVLQEFANDYHAYPQQIWKTTNDWATEQSSVWWAALERQMVPTYNPFGPDHDVLDKGVWLCPSAHRPANLTPQLGYTSYGYNSWGLGLRDSMLGLGGGPSGPLKESDIATPSELLAIGDAFVGNFGQGVIRDGGGLHRTTMPVPTGPILKNYDYAASTRRAKSRHSGKANIVFADGHVSAPTLDFLFTDLSDKALESWNIDHQPHREFLTP